MNVSWIGNRVLYHAYCQGRRACWGVGTKLHKEVRLHDRGVKHKGLFQQEGGVEQYTFLSKLGALLKQLLEDVVVHELLRLTCIHDVKESGREDHLAVGGGEVLVVLGVTVQQAVEVALRLHPDHWRWSDTFGVPLRCHKVYRN